MPSKRNTAPAAENRYAWISLGLVALTLLVFFQVRQFDFLHFDDANFILNNPHIRNGISMNGIRWALAADLWEDSHLIDYWQPVTLLSRMLDIEWFGLNPGGHHVMNLWFHLVNALFVFSLFRKMTGALWPSAFAAAVFSVHPIQAEPVAWITARKDVLSTFFGLWTLLLYLRWLEKRSWLRYGTMLTMYTLSILTKPMLVTLPLLMVTLDYWPLGRYGTCRGNKERCFLAIEKMPLLLLALAVGTATWINQQIYVTHLSLPFLAANVPLCYAFYLKIFFYPHALAIRSVLPGMHVSWLNVFLSACVILFMSVFVLARRKTRPYLVTGWYWFIIGLIPVASQPLFPDRFMYVPMLGLAIITAWGVSDVFRRFAVAQWLRFSITLVLLAVLAGFSYRQTSYWKNDITLFSHALRVTENNYIAHAVLGNALIPADVAAPANEGVENAADVNAELAIKHLTKAIAMNPGFAHPYGNLGILRVQLGQYEEAERLFRKAIQIKPDFVDARYSLAKLLEETGRRSEAVVQYETLLSLAPDYTAAHNNLGNIFYREGRPEEAILHYKKAIDIDPEFEKARRNLAWVKAAGGVNT